MANKSRFFYGYTVVIISFFCMMVILGLQASFGIFVKPIIDSLGWTRTVTSGAFSLSQIVGGISCIAIGWLNDRIGPRVSITLGGLLSVLGYLLISQMQSVWQLYVFYGVLIGVGVGTYAPILSTVARWFFKRRSAMSGIACAGAGCGMLLFPPLVNWLLLTYDWHLTFIVLAIIIFVVSILSAMLFKSDPGKIGQKAYGENSTQAEGVNSGVRSFTLKEAALTRQFWLFCIATLFYGFCFFSLDVHIAPYAMDTGISAAGAAIVLSILGGATIVGQIGLGSIGDRIGYQRAFLIGLVCVVAAALTLMLAGQLWAFYLSAIFLGLAFGNCSTQESPLTAWLYGLTSHGVIFGIISCSFTIGAAIGPLIFGYIFDSTGSYRYALWIASILSIAAVVLAFFIRRTVTESALKTLSADKVL